MNESSERRSAGRSIRDALRNACGYTEPEWGELKMIGARHAAGSTISNGGDSSPLNWVIVGRRPWNPYSDPSFLPEKRSFYEDSLSIITAVLPSEKSLKPAGTYPAGFKLFSLGRPASEKS